MFETIFFGLMHSSYTPKLTEIVYLPKIKSFSHEHKPRERSDPDFTPIGLFIIKLIKLANNAL